MQEREYWVNCQRTLLPLPPVVSPFLLSSSPRGRKERGKGGSVRAEEKRVKEGGRERRRGKREDDL